MKPTIKMKTARKLMPTLLALAICGPAFAVQNLALLVGVGKYAVKPLDGPPNDVDAMRSVLTQRWGFVPGDVKTLKDAEATRSAILAELDELAKRAKPGDNVFIYYSGHGISALDSGSTSAGISLPQSSGALVPHDAIKASSDGKFIQASKLIVGRDDLRPRLDRLDASGAHVVVIADACYSGQAVRSINRPGQGIASLPKRYIAEYIGDYGVNLKVVDMDAANGRVATIAPYPYKNVVFLSAAAQGEVALDINNANIALVPTQDGKAHGAMTDALLRVMKNELGADSDGNGKLSYYELQTAVTGFMADRGYGHSPQLLPPVAEDSQGLATRGVLGSGKFANSEAMRQPPVIAPSLQVAAPNIQDAAVLNAIAAVPGVQQVGKQAGDLTIREEVRGTYQIRTQSGDLMATAASLPKLTSVLAGYSAAQRLRGVAQKGQRAVLPFAVNPADFGGNFLFGQKVNFVVRPDRAATLVVFNLDANGKWTTLYPGAKSEQAALVASKAHFIPGESPAQMIDVTPPEGMDSVFAFAFDEPPAGLDAITGLNAVDLQDPRMERFTAGLGKMAGRYTFGRAELRAFPPLKRQ